MGLKVKGVKISYKISNVLNEVHYFNNQIIINLVSDFFLVNPPNSSTKWRCFLESNVFLVLLFIFLQTFECLSNAFALKLLPQD